MPTFMEPKKTRCLEEQECGQNVKIRRVDIGEDPQCLSQTKRASAFDNALTLAEHLAPENKRARIEEASEVEVALRDLSGHVHAFSVARTSKVSLLKELLHDQEGLKPENLRFVQKRRFVDDDALVQDCIFFPTSESRKDRLELVLLILQDEDLWQNEDEKVEKFRAMFAGISLRNGPSKHAHRTGVKVNCHEGETDEVAVLQVQGGWSRIRFKGRPGVGWLRSECLVRDSDVPPGSLLVCQERCHLFESPSSWTHIKDLVAGDRVRVTGPLEVIEGFVMVPVMFDGECGAVQLKCFRPSSVVTDGLDSGSDFDPDCGSDTESVQSSDKDFFTDFLNFFSRIPTKRHASAKVPDDLGSGSDSDPDSNSSEELFSDDDQHEDTAQPAKKQRIEQYDEKQRVIKDEPEEKQQDEVHGMLPPEVHRILPPEKQQRIGEDVGTVQDEVYQTVPSEKKQHVVEDEVHRMAPPEKKQRVQVTPGSCVHKSKAPCLIDID